MADTVTTHYNWVKPEISGSPTTWGVKWNANLDQMDATIFGLTTAPSLVPIGAILAWPSFVIPTNYFLCDGSVYNVSDAPLLYTVSGDWGGGNGTTTFGVPNLDGAVLFGITSNVSSYGPLNTQFPGDFDSEPADFNYLTIAFIIRYK